MPDPIIIDFEESGLSEVEGKVQELASSLSKGFEGSFPGDELGASMQEFTAGFDGVIDKGEEYSELSEKLTKQAESFFALQKQKQQEQTKSQGETNKSLFKGIKTLAGYGTAAMIARKAVKVLTEAVKSYLKAAEQTPELFSPDQLKRAQALSKEVENVSASFTKLKIDIVDDVAPAITEAASSISVWIDAGMPLVSVTGELERKQKDLVDSYESSDRAMLIYAKSAGIVIDTNAALIREQEELAETMGNVLSAGMNMTSMTEDYETSLASLNEELEVEKGILKDLVDNEWSDTSSKMIEQQEIVSDLRGEIVSMADAMEESTERWILSLLAQGGATVEAQIAYAEFAGLIDEKSAEAASNILEIATSEDLVGSSAEEMAGIFDEAMNAMIDKSPDTINVIDELKDSMIPVNEEFQKAKNVTNDVINHLRNFDGTRSTGYMDVFVTRYSTTVNSSGASTAPNIRPFSPGSAGGGVFGPGGSNALFANGVSDFVVPAGFPNDSFKAGLTSGETVDVSKPGESNNGFDMDDFEGRMAGVMVDAVRGFAKQVGVVIQKG